MDRVEEGQAASVSGNTFGCSHSVWSAPDLGWGQLFYSENYYYYTPHTTDLLDRHFLIPRSKNRNTNPLKVRQLLLSGFLYLTENFI